MNYTKKILNEFSKEEKQVIESWAVKAYVLKNDETLTKLEKIKKIQITINENKIIIIFLKKFIETIKKHGWDERSIPMKMSIAGVTLGIGISGGQFAGIATAGFGIGIPIFLLTGAGGALLGTIIEELKKDKN